MKAFSLLHLVVLFLLHDEDSYVYGLEHCAWIMYSAETCQDKIDQDGLTRWLSSALEIISSMNVMTIALSSERKTETFDAAKINYQDEGYCSTTACDQVVDTPIWCNVDESSCKSCDNNNVWCTNFRGYCNVGAALRTAESSICDGIAAGHPVRNENKDNCEHDNYGRWCTSVYPEWGQGFCSYDGQCQTQGGGDYCQLGKVNCDSPCKGEWCNATESIPAFDAPVGYCTWSTCQGEPSSRGWCDQSIDDCQGKRCRGNWCIDGAPTPAPTSPSGYAGYCDYWGHCDEYEKPERNWCDMTSQRCTQCKGKWCPPKSTFNGTIFTYTPTQAPTPDGPYHGYCEWGNACNKYDTVNRTENWCHGTADRCEDKCSGTWCKAIGGATFNPTSSPTLAPTPDGPHLGYCEWGDTCNKYEKVNRNDWCHTREDRCTGSSCNGRKWCNAIGGAVPTLSPTPSGSYAGYCKWVDLCNEYDTVNRTGNWCHGSFDRCNNTCGGTWCPAIGGGGGSGGGERRGLIHFEVDNGGESNHPASSANNNGKYNNEYGDDNDNDEGRALSLTGTSIIVGDSDDKEGLGNVVVSTGSTRSSNNNNNNNKNVAIIDDMKETPRQRHRQLQKVGSGCAKEYCYKNHKMCALAGCPGYKVRRERRRQQRRERDRNLLLRSLAEVTEEEEAEDDATILLGLSMGLAKFDKSAALSDPSLTFRFRLSDGYAVNGTIILPYIPQSNDTISCNPAELYMLGFSL